jgi:sirohydrochlorin ferrochelatase
MEATVFIGHGSRNDAGNSEFVQFIENLFLKVDSPIKGYGFLEKAQPTIQQALETAILSGATIITVIPVFLLPGIHANKDVPFEVSFIQHRYPTITIHYGAPIGIDELIIELLLERLLEKGYRNEKVLLIGHGSREPAAAKELSELGLLLEKKIGAKVKIAYLKAEPVFTDLFAESKEKIYIIPYLLFSGGFVNLIKEKARKLEHIVCDPIGFHEKLQYVLLKRMHQAKVIK